MMQISVTINGKNRKFDTAAGEKVDALLRREGYISVRNGCDGQGSCGACSIILDKKTVNSCLLLTGQIDGKEVYTIDFFSKTRELNVIQKSFVEAGVVQCGYCTPAMILASKELLDRHPAPTRTQIKDALSGIFCRCTGFEQLFLAIELSAKRMKDANFKMAIAPEFCENLRVVGKVKKKIDGPQLARGERAFVEDMVLPNSLHLKMLRSPYAHAYIKKIDTTEASKISGVALILTHENSPDIPYNQAGQGFPEPSPYDRRLFGKKVRHVGDRVAAVVADSAEIAMEAIKKIRVEYEVMEPLLSIEDAKAEGAPLVHNSRIEYISGAPEDYQNKNADPRDGKIIYQFPIQADPRKNVAASVQNGIGDIEKGFIEADVIIEREYETSQVQCTPLEPHVVYTRMERDRLVIHASTQVPWHLRRIVARILGISENKIRVIKERVGGGFGAKQDIVLEDVAAYCTWVTGKPVLFRFTREEEFIASRTRHPMKFKIKLGAKENGKLTSMSMTLEANTGPFGSHCLTVPMNACSKSLPLFLCENIAFDVTTYYSNIPPTGAYQGYGAPQGSFAMQLAVRELAAELGMDHLQFLEINRVRDGSTLEILKCLGEGREGKAEKVSSCGLGPALKRGAEMIEWGKNEDSGDEDVKIGKGLAIIQQGSGLPGIDSANASITLLGDGTLMLLSGGADLGTGLDTLSVKMVSECLCTDMEGISIVAADTDVTPYDDGAYASSGTFFSGGAALITAQKMKKRLLSIASQILEEKESNLELVYPSTIKGKNDSVTFKQIARYCLTGTGQGQITEVGNFITDKAAFPYGAHFCQVAVNIKTGQVHIHKYYALQDCGTPINPELALGQIYGGSLKTIGHSLYEEMILDDKGRCLNSNLLDYRAPMIGDIPDDFKALLIYTPDPFGPYGGKSISEIACNGAAPAIASAIFDATGVWIRSWPFSPEKILKQLKKI